MEDCIYDLHCQASTPPNGTGAAAPPNTVRGQHLQLSPPDLRARAHTLGGSMAASAAETAAATAEPSAAPSPEVFHAGMRDGGGYSYGVQGSTKSPCDRGEPAEEPLSPPSTAPIDGLVAYTPRYRGYELERTPPGSASKLDGVDEGSPMGEGGGYFGRLQVNDVSLAVTVVTPSAPDPLVDATHRNHRYAS